MVNAARCWHDSFVAMELMQENTGEKGSHSYFAVLHFLLSGLGNYRVGLRSWSPVCEVLCTDLLEGDGAWTTLIQT